VGHDEKDYRTMDLMSERNSDTYMVKEDMMTGKNAPHFN
jgi:hypothetical protein